MSDLIYSDFLNRQVEEGLALADQSDLLALRPLPGPVPAHFLAEFRCRGLVRDSAGHIVEHDCFVVGIWFPPDYLRRTVHVSHVLTYLGPAERPWHANINPPFICMNLWAGMGLTQILHALFDLLTWNSHACHDALNAEAAQWARNQPQSRFPVDRRPLKWRASQTVDRPAAGSLAPGKGVPP
jgi:hypothetical protein